MSISDVVIRNTKPQDKPFKLSDSAGLFHLVKPNGSKIWYLKYRYDGKETGLWCLSRRLLSAGQKITRQRTLRIGSR
jgi:hypothetical protein